MWVVEQAKVMRKGTDLAFLDGGTFQGTKEAANLFTYAMLDIWISDGRLKYAKRGIRREMSKS
jgi:hypothetical protein